MGRRMESKAYRPLGKIRQRGDTLSEMPNSDEEAGLSNRQSRHRASHYKRKIRGARSYLLKI